MSISIPLSLKSKKAILVLSEDAIIDAAKSK